MAYLTGGGFVCVTDLKYLLGTSSTPDGVSHDTPFLSTEGYNGKGQLFLTWVDNASLNLHISQVVTPDISFCNSTGGFNVNRGATTNVTTDTSWDGPAFITSGYNGTSGGSSEKFFLVWAGTDSGHHINIAQYLWDVQGPSGLMFSRVAKHTETNHATTTDMGGDYDAADGQAFMSYCGTNNDVYFQSFSTVNGGTEVQEGGVSCSIFVSGGFYSGGAGISYDYTDLDMLLSWPNKSTHNIEMTEV
jgi:hypothetical protein